MKKHVCMSTILVAALLSGSAHADRFESLWYDGNAEISTYRLSEMRYGQARENGRRIMVFVTEPMRLSTNIKPDVKLPDEEKIDVIKLNDLRKFTTGIYEYSVMTSVFASVDESKEDIPLMGTMKTSFTSQEWCGTVFERMVRNDETYDGVLYSYFESEGETTYVFPHNKNAESEDNLWLIVRELKGEILKPGDSKELPVVLSSWTRRKRHEPPRVATAVLKKGGPQKVSTAIGKMDAHTFTWDIDGNVTTVVVEKAYPHRILSFEEPDGSRGEIIASRRETYWEQTKNKHQKLRKKLELPREEEM